MKMSLMVYGVAYAEYTWWFCIWLTFIFHINDIHFLIAKFDCLDNKVLLI